MISFQPQLRQTVRTTSWVFSMVEETPFSCKEKLLMRKKFTMWILRPCTRAWTNKYCEVPLGYPEILSSEALGDRSPVDFFGMIKCEIHPPSFLIHFFLPYRANGKLTEHLLRTPCEHNDRERTLSGTWPSIEIKDACEPVYRVVRLIAVEDFQNRSRVY